MYNVHYRIVSFEPYSLTELLNPCFRVFYFLNIVDKKLKEEKIKEKRIGTNLLVITVAVHHEFVDKLEK